MPKTSATISRPGAPDGDGEVPFRSYALDRAGAPRFHIRIVEHTQRVYPPHKHDYFQILYFTTAAPALRIGLTSHKPVPGSIYFVAPMVPHQVRFDRDTRCVVIYFDLDFLRQGLTRSYPIAELVRLAPELTPFAWQNHVPFNLEKALAQRVDAAVASMVAFAAKEGVFALEIVRAELALMLATVCQEHEAAFAELASRLQVVGRDSGHMRRISEYIGDNYTRGPTLAEAASAVHLSKSRLCGLIRQYTHTTFNALIRDMRIEDACEQLALTDSTIGQIAYAVGYSDEKYFLRAFKKTIGVTPNAYRLKHARGYGPRAEMRAAGGRSGSGGGQSPAIRAVK